MTASRRYPRRIALAHGVACAALAGAQDDAPALISGIEKQVLVPSGAAGPTWFHPRACRARDHILMTLQPILGSDHFGHVHFTTSRDGGRTWAPFQPVPSLGHEPAPDGWQEGVCDVTPEHHAPSDSVLALGHNVFYRGAGFERGQPPRWPIYAVWRAGCWGPRRRLVWDDPRASAIYSNNCGQRVVMPDGDVIMSFTFGVRDRPRAVCGVRCGFDGETLAIKETGNALTNDHARGLLEPSVTRFGSRFYLTIRAEDRRGYVSVSDDGLRYEPQLAWAWDDGEPLTMSSTQQHWLAHADGLFLVYTRHDASNAKITRWRAPLWIAQVDPDQLRLIRSTERVVLPIVGDAENHPERVSFNGNFGVTHATPDESWVTDGSWCPATNLGEVALARVRWGRPNQLGD